MILCGFLQLLIVILLLSLLLTKEPHLSHPLPDHLCPAFPFNLLHLFLSYLLCHNFVGRVGWSHCIVLAVLGKGVWLVSLGMTSPSEGKGPGIKGSLKSWFP